jgi:two-component system sensor histidine kinase YesM
MAVNEDYENLAEFSKQMGTYFQYITRNAGMITTLADEVRHAEFMQISKPIVLETESPWSLMSCLWELHGTAVPKMILQPVIENVFEHGLKNKVKNGFLKIHYQSDKDSIYLIVEDNGDDLRDEDLYCLKQDWQMRIQKLSLLDGKYS